MIKKINTILKNPSLRYTLMSIIASGINFMTLIVFGRVFSVEDYGIVTTLQAFVTNVAVFMTPLQIMICKTMAEDRKGEEKELASIFSILVVINIVELIFLMLLSKKVAMYLHFTNIIEYVLFICFVFLNNIYVVINGIIQGKQDFVLLGNITIILYTVKMLLGMFLGWIGLGPTAVIIGFSVAEIISIAIIIRKLFKVMRNQLVEYNFKIDKGVLKYYVWTLILYIMVSFYMNNGDILVGNLYCSKEEIGIYSVAINLSKISTFLIATPVAMILLPKVAANSGNIKKQNKLLLIAEIVTFIVSALYGVFFCLLGGWLIRLLYGEVYSAASNYILSCTVFSTILGVFWVFYQYALATDLMKIFTIMTVVFGAIVVGGLIVIHCPLVWIPVLMSVAMVITVLFSLFIKELRYRKYKI